MAAAEEMIKVATNIGTTFFCGMIRKAAVCASDTKLSEVCNGSGKNSHRRFALSCCKSYLQFQGFNKSTWFT